VIEEYSINLNQNWNSNLVNEADFSPEMNSSRPVRKQYGKVVSADQA
jgi:hypothetical protein